MSGRFARLPQRPSRQSGPLKRASSDQEWAGSSAKPLSMGKTGWIAVAVIVLVAAAATIEFKLKEDTGGVKGLARKAMFWSKEDPPRGNDVAGVSQIDDEIRTMRSSAAALLSDADVERAEAERCRREGRLDEAAARAERERALRAKYAGVIARIDSLEKRMKEEGGTAK